MYREWSVSHVPRPYRAAASQALEADGARRLWNESFFSAPQLKRDPLGCARKKLQERFSTPPCPTAPQISETSVGLAHAQSGPRGREGLVERGARSVWWAPSSGPPCRLSGGSSYGGGVAAPMHRARVRSEHR